MEKLGDVTIENSLSLAVNCQVDQHLLAKNFTTILNALKELQLAQQKTQSQVKDLSSLKDKYEQLAQKVEKGGISNNKDKAQGGHDDVINNDGLVKRVQKNESNIMDNIKDINLINKEITSLKDLISNLQNNVQNNNSSEHQKTEKNGYALSDVASNMSKELQINAEKMKQLQIKLLKAEEQLSKHQNQIRELFENKDKKVINQPQRPSSNRNQNVQELKKDLRQKLDIINKKINSLQSDSDNHEQQITYLKDILGQKEEDKSQHQINPVTPRNNGDGVSYKDLNELKKKIEEVDRRETKDIKNLIEQINNLKLQLKSKGEKIDSKSSIEDQSKIKIRKPSIHRDDLNDKINDLIMRVTYLQKLQSSNKNNEDKNPQKLPAINRPKKKDPNLTSYQQKDKSLISRRDLGDLRAQLEAWIKNLFDQNKDRQNFQALQLKIQEIKKNIQRKADAEGTKKGFSFLQNKITQLYLFLTQPDTEDAMIVRKGFNCLSCSKRVQKLRGRIAPKLNWNNMTTTNYSPPRVGYSKPMGQSGDKQEDI